MDKIYNGLEEVNTSEAFFGEILRTNNTLIFPYINIEILKRHPLRTETAHRLNKAYIIFNNVRKIEWDYSHGRNINKYEQNISSEEGDRVEYIGGSSYELGHDVEIKVYFGEAYLQLLTDTKMSSKYFIPKDTPNFHPNMEVSDATSFFKNQQLPESIESILGTHRAVFSLKGSAGHVSDYHLTN